MAKYSTGSGGDSAGGSCELCGAEGGDLQTAQVAGATLQLCSDCARNHGETDRTQTSGHADDERSRRKKAAQNTARLADAQKGDASHWEDGADYDDDQLPYLVKGYGKRVTEARQAAGLQTGDLAEELDAEESDVLAIEQGRATQAGVGGSLVAKLEAFLDVELVAD
ncbi:multiprotein-bridging factor 1 family protein [Halomicroarcula sp. GCM10025324]|jgi:ribosome-binding protein aMBF1 (putative translation factor)|uniref:helix-turn-helix domain-containing protein n=1 Tax=Haloarcula TaxID=2237 RepID=UPI0023E7954C|nr:multiprotein-bridging factor 1 family protein [Halomicroarcula sp. ZS-22-S1]